MDRPWCERCVRDLLLCHARDPDEPGPWMWRDYTEADLSIFVSPLEGADELLARFLQHLGGEFQSLLNPHTESAVVPDLAPFVKDRGRNHDPDFGTATPEEVDRLAEDHVAVRVLLEGDDRNLVVRDHHATLLDQRLASHKEPPFRAVTRFESNLNYIILKIFVK